MERLLSVQVSRCVALILPDPQPADWEQGEASSLLGKGPGGFREAGWPCVVKKEQVKKGVEVMEKETGQ